MENRYSNWHAFLNEVGFGEFRVKIVDRSTLIIPKQLIERPGKNGVQSDLIIHVPITFKLA